MIDRIIKVNLGSEGVPPLVKITQGDTQWRFAFQVFWNNQRYTIPSGSTAILSGRKPDGHGVELTGSISSNTVYVSCTAQFTAVSGLVPCTLQLFDSSGKLVNSCPVIFACAPDAKGGAEVSASDLSAYEELLETVQQLLADYNAAGAVPGYVSAWLAENITNPDSPPVDASLTVTGAAADAKATGDWISPLYFDSNDESLWTVGAIGSSTGANSASTTRLRTAGYIGAVCKKITVNSGYKYMIFGYSDGAYMGTWDGTSFVKSGNWRTTETDLTVLPAYDFRLVMAYSDDGAITTSAASNVKLLFSTDTALTTPGVAADAKTTGDAVGGLRAEMFNISSNVTVLSDGTDFDTLRDPAVYRISNNTHAATMLNIPSKTSGKLIVCATASSLKVYQIYATTTSATFMYVRQYDGSAWGGWNRILSSYDLTTINNSLTTINNRLTELEKAIYIKHESGSWTNFTEVLYICIPTYDGYILYKMRHYVRQDNNCNCWTIYKAYHVDDNFENEIQLTITAEWECAVHIADRDDFSGGNMHGDEIMQNVSFLVDGASVDITAFTSYTKCGSLKILRNSTLYDPADHTTAIANHGVEYTFNSESGLIISQSIKWLNSYSLTNCFLAMFPPSKAYIDRASFNSDFEVVELASDVSTSQPVITKNNASGIEAWDTSSGFSAKVYTPVYPTGLTGGDRMIVSDNGDEDYNKFYFKVCDNQSVSANAFWKSESVYMLNYKSS